MSASSFFERIQRIEKKRSLSNSEERNSLEVAEEEEGLKSNNNDDEEFNSAILSQEFNFINDNSNLSNGDGIEYEKKRAAPSKPGKTRHQGGISLSDALCSKKEDAQYKDGLKPMKAGITRTNDDIHKSIDLCPASRTVIDTPQVQRLRKLRQLGVAEYAFMNVTHTRFEHSIGVMHLAEKLCRRIQRRQPQLDVTEKDVLCVKLAGLCHDLGHGPFSHVFERVTNLKKTHEEASLMMIDALLAHLGLAIDEQELDKPLKQIGSGIQAESFGVYASEKELTSGQTLPCEDIFTSRDWMFIKECIVAQPLTGYDDYIGRPLKKEFLYDVVSNRHNGLDVDKIDYFARDKRRALGSSGEVDIMFVREAFVAWGECPVQERCFRCSKLSTSSSIVPPTPQKLPSRLPRISPSRHCYHLMICYPEKLIIPAMEFFQTRFSLHSKVYTHKACVAVEFMIKDIFEYAEPYFRVHYKEPPTYSMPSTTKSIFKHVTIGEAIFNPHAYLELNDSILDKIYDQSPTTPDLQKASNIIERYRARQLYKCAVVQEINDIPKHRKIWQKYTEKDVESELVHLYQHQSSTEGIEDISNYDIIVEKREIHHGSKESNPVSRMRFLPKIQLSKLESTEIESLPEAVSANDQDYIAHIPRVFLKRTIRIYCRSPSKRHLIEHIFQQWWADKESEFDEQNQLQTLEEDGINVSNISSDCVLLSQEDTDEKNYAASASTSAGEKPWSKRRKTSDDWSS